MIRKLRLLSILLLYSVVSVSQAGIQVVNVIQDVPATKIKNIDKPNIKATEYRTVTIDTQLMRQELKGVAHRDGLKPGVDMLIELPLPDGSMHRYRVMENSTMNPVLAAKFPEIKTYNGYGIGDSNEFVKFDITPQGFHAMILSPGKSPIFIDPYSKSKNDYYMVYKKSNFQTNKKMRCSVSSSSSSFKYYNKIPSFVDFSTCFLRKYRLAVAATAEYTQFSGGTVELALAAQATTVNRVNGVYETDLGVTLEIIANNDEIIYTDPNTDPYTSGDAVLMIDENQANIDTVIGAGNYDVGHVFDQGVNSGLAGLGVVCNDPEKALGVTGSINPVGDPFDIDYVAHEFGHQFNANHVQNNDCQRNDPTAVEPGSGSTIMGYAGICEPNVQLNSDAYFNGINLQEIGAFLNGSGGACAAKTAISAAPVVATLANIIIPVSTPFALTGSASGAGSANYTYAWEQQDNQVSPQPPEATSLDGPNFRSFSPTLNETRYFPNLISLANNGPFTWEVIPSVSRTMNFRLSVRANTPGGSCNAYRDMTVDTDAGSGPFQLTHPSATGIEWRGGTNETITWNVANTDNVPVSAAKVDIFMSTDGGQTYPLNLAKGVANNGASLVNVPSVDTSTARIMVRSANGIFFTISANNFKITPAPSTLLAPTLTSVLRNPLNKNNAFVYFSTLGNAVVSDIFTINGLPSATVTLDMEHNRFVVSLINTPRKVANVSITVSRAGGSNAITNPITIPGIL